MPQPYEPSINYSLYLQHLNEGVDACTAERWRLLSRYCDTHPFESEWDYKDDLFHQIGDLSQYVASGAPNWPDPDGLLSSSRLPHMVIALTTGVYGGLHLMAWAWHFPTRAEWYLWVSSASFIAISGTIIALYLMAYKIRQRVSLKQGPILYRDFMTDFENFCTVLYIIARIYIVVEAFASIRSLPVDVYQTPDWTEWIPHL